MDSSYRSCLYSLKNLCVLVLITFQILNMSSGAVHEFQTNDEYVKFRKEQKIPHTVLYYHHSGDDKSFKSRTKDMMIQADQQLEEQGTPIMSFAMINCMNSGVDESKIPGCEGGRRKLFTYKAKHEPKRFSLRALPNTESFLAQMIHYVHDTDISIVNNALELQKLHESMVGKGNVLLVYFPAIGSKDHYSLMMYFIQNPTKMEYVFTNDEPLAASLGKKDDQTHAMWFTKCTEDPSCPSEMVSDVGQLEYSHIDTFVNLQTLPYVTELNADGSSSYDEATSVHVLYLFVESDDQKRTLTDMVTGVIEKARSGGLHVRAAIVDRRKHGAEMLSNFGITMDTMFPTTMLKPYIIPTKKKTEKGDESEEGGDEITPLDAMEPFTPDEDLTADSLFTFIENCVKNRDSYFKSIADVFFIQYLQSNEWKGLNNIKRDSFIAVCSKKPEMLEKCTGFKLSVRRLVRTMYTVGFINFDCMFVDEVDNNEMEDFNSVPAIALVHGGKVTVLEGDEYGDYATTLKMFSETLKKDLPTLPVSGADLLHLPPHAHTNENNDITEDGEENLIRLQEDEIGLVANKKRSERFYEDKVFQLTDENFGKVLNATELSLVFYITPVSDDISFLVQSMIANIDAKVAQDTPSVGTPAKVMKLKCEDHWLACRGINVFPNIRFISKGKVLGTYKGILDESSILATLRLYQKPSVTKLSEESLLKYKQPAVSKTVSVLGLFHTENEDFAVYKKIADEYHGKMKFEYATSAPALKLLPDLASSSSVVASYVQGQQSRVLDGTHNPFTETALRDMLKQAPIARFGELTMANFPVYKSFNKPLLVLFTHKGGASSIAHQMISTVVKDLSMEKHAFYTWMNTELQVTKDIRRSYLGTHKDMKADIVIVNHTKGEVYHYTGPQDNVEVSAQELSAWIVRCAEGNVPAKSYLKVVNWKPLREGFDFLNLIDNDMIRAGLTREQWKKDQAGGKDEETEETVESAAEKELPKLHGMKVPKKYADSPRPTNKPADTKTPAPGTINMDGMDKDEQEAVREVMAAENESGSELTGDIGEPELSEKEMADEAEFENMLKEMKVDITDAEQRRQEL